MQPGLRLYRVDPGFGKPFAYFVAANILQAADQASLHFAGVIEVKELHGSRCFSSSGVELTEFDTQEVPT